MLSLLSKIKEGETINISNKTIVKHDSITTSALRWLKSEDRNKLVLAIHDEITSTITEYLESHDPNLNVLLNMAVSGLKNLIVTYKSDLNIKSNLEKLIKLIESFNKTTFYQSDHMIKSETLSNKFISSSLPTTSLEDSWPLPFDEINCRSSSAPTSPLFNHFLQSKSKSNYNYNYGLGLKYHLHAISGNTRDHISHLDPHSKTHIQSETYILKPKGIMMEEDLTYSQTSQTDELNIESLDESINTIYFGDSFFSST